MRGSTSRTATETGRARRRRRGRRGSARPGAPSRSRRAAALRAPVRARPQMIVITASTCAQPIRPFHETARAPEAGYDDERDRAQVEKQPLAAGAFVRPRPAGRRRGARRGLTQPQTVPASHRPHRSGCSKAAARPPLDGRSDTNDRSIDRSLGRSFLRSELTTAESSIAGCRRNRDLILPTLHLRARLRLGRSSAVMAQALQNAKRLPTVKYEISRLSTHRDHRPRLPLWHVSPGTTGRSAAEVSERAGRRGVRASPGPRG